MYSMHNQHPTSFSRYIFTMLRHYFKIVKLYEKIKEFRYSKRFKGDGSKNQDRKRYTYIIIRSSS